MDANSNFSNVMKSVLKFDGLRAAPLLLARLTFVLFTTPRSILNQWVAVVSALDEMTASDEAEFGLCMTLPNKEIKQQNF